MPDEVVVANLSEIVAKVFPFFDNSRKSRDSAAAMSCIASLADFVIKCKLGDFKEVFREVVVTDVLVSLVIFFSISSVFQVYFKLSNTVQGALCSV